MLFSGSTVLIRIKEVMKNCSTNIILKVNDYLKTSLSEQLVPYFNKTSFPDTDSLPT
jgi:hypothetical protein